MLDHRVGCPGYHLRRFADAYAGRLDKKVNRVAMRTATEAVVEAFLVIDVEAGCLVSVERAAGAKLATKFPQAYRRPDHR